MECVIINFTLHISHFTLIVCPLRRSAFQQHLFQRAVPFVFADGLANPVVIFVALGERHVVGYQFHNPRFRNAVVQELAELEVLFVRAVSVVQNDECGGLSDNQCRFQEVRCIFDRIAGVHGGIFCQIAVLQKPTEGPLTEAV